MDLPSTCTIAENPDIVGIVIRASIYAQACLAGPAFLFMMFWKRQPTKKSYSDFYGAYDFSTHPSRVLKRLAIPLMLTSLALIVTLLIQARTGAPLTVYHTLIALNLAWMSNYTGFMLHYIAIALTVEDSGDCESKPLPVLSRLPQGDLVKRVQLYFRNAWERLGAYLRHASFRSFRRSVQSFFHILLLRLRYLFKDVWIFSTHSTVLSVVGIWFWVDQSAFLRGFDSNDVGCGEVTYYWIFVPIRATSFPLRVWSLAAYSLNLLPILSAAIHAFPTLLFLRPGGFRPRSRVSAILGAYLIAPNVFLVVATEMLIVVNRKSVERGLNNNWTFGQTLALIGPILSVIQVLTHFWNVWREDMKPGRVGKKEQKEALDEQTAQLSYFSRNPFPIPSPVRSQPPTIDYVGPSFTTTYSPIAPPILPEIAHI